MPQAQIRTDQPEQQDNKKQHLYGKDLEEVDPMVKILQESGLII